MGSKVKVRDEKTKEIWGVSVQKWKMVNTKHGGPTWDKKTGIMFLIMSIYSPRFGQRQFSAIAVAHSLLICTLISENQGLLHTLEKFQVLQTSIFFFQVSTLKKGWVYSVNLKKNPGAKPEKKSRFAEPEIFLGFEINLDFSRPWFSEISVQIKRPLHN